ncbi:hypothetical protein TeGR_g11602 [Tetraparma gracilis]|uniref:Choline transporter-like protein n=1 Tax=Tetraparma gracilis TaxID=2962635 RepID=A0ABQ6M775_9STRA|nr:hypothetical protein TeGR_g11602 [Tetraparma gracilis]
MQTEQTDADKNNPDNKPLEGNADFKGPGANRGCIKTCPTEDNFEEFYCKYSAQKKINDQVALAELEAEGSGAVVASAMYVSYVTSYECMPVMATRDYLGYCVPELAIAAATAAASAALNGQMRKKCQTDDTTEYPVAEDNAGGQHDGDKAYWKDVESPINCTAPRLGIEVTADFLDPASEDGFFDRISADMYTAQSVILGFGLGVAMVMGFAYLFFIRLPGVLSMLIWGLLFCVFACFMGLGGYMYMTSKKWLDEATTTTMTVENEDGTTSEEEVVTDGPHSQAEIDGTLYIGYFFAGLGGCWALFICCIRKRIILAIGCVKEAAKAMQAMPVITIYPVFQVIGVLLFLIPWLVYVTFLASSGDVKVSCIKMSASGMLDQANSAYQMAEAASEGETYEEEATCEEGDLLYKTMAYNTNTKFAGLYLLFCWFWTSQFVIAAGQLVVAMSVSMWYFTKDKKTVGNGTFFKAAKSAMWYHMGTAAFGSLIIAIIKTIRAVVAYLQKKAAKSKNKILVAVLCAIQCYMWCLEKCMKFLNKNAYIQTAIFGYSFCKAARKAFFLILRNILRIAALAIVSEFVLILGKLFIMTGTTVLAYMMMEQNFEGQINYLWWPTLLTCFVSYFTAEMFNEVFGMAISTILQCFVADEEMFKPEERFAEGDLATTVSKINKQHAANEGGAAIHPESNNASSDKYEAKPEAGEELP